MYGLFLTSGKAIFLVYFCNYPTLCPLSSSISFGKRFLHKAVVENHNRNKKKIRIKKQRLLLGSISSFVNKEINYYI